MMKTASPIFTPLESAMMPSRGSGGTASSWSRARSALGWNPITRACTGSCPRNSTVMSSIPWTTWDAVTTFPSRETSTPDPVSPKRVTPPWVTSLPLARMTTTLGLAFRYKSPRVCGCPKDGAVPTSARATSERVRARMPKSSACCSAGLWSTYAERGYTRDTTRNVRLLSGHSLSRYRSGAIRGRLRWFSPLGRTRAMPEETHLTVVMDEQQGPDREGAEHEDDDHREREIHRGHVVDAGGGENGADPPHPEHEGPRVDHQIVQRPEEHRVRRGGGDEHDEHHGEDPHIWRAREPHLEGMGVFERIVAVTHEVTVERERSLHGIPGQQLLERQRQMVVGLTHRYRLLPSIRVEALVSDRDRHLILVERVMDRMTPQWQLCLLYTSPSPRDS